MTLNGYAGLFLAFAVTSVMVAPGIRREFECIPVAIGWHLIAPAEEAVSFDELRAVLGNLIVVNAIQTATLHFLTEPLLSSWPGSAFRLPNSNPPLCLARPPRRKFWSETTRNTQHRTRLACHHQARVKGP